MDAIRIDLRRVSFPITLTIDRLGGVDGLSPTVAIRDVASGLSLDWSDNHFKASGWTTRFKVMTGLGRGLYMSLLPLALLVPAVTIDSILLSEFHVDDGGEFKGDDHDLITFDKLETTTALLQKFHKNKGATTPGAPGRFVIYDDDDATPILDQQLTDDQGNPTRSATGSPARRSKSTV